MRVTDEHGNWADIKELKDLTSGDADAVEDSAGLEFEVPEGMTDQSAEEIGALVRKSLVMTPDRMHRARDALFAAVITGWSLEGVPLPSEDLTACKRIPLALRYELEKATEPHAVAMRRRPDPKATGRSTSNGSSRAGVRSRRA